MELIDYPKEIIPGNEYKIKYKVESNWFDNYDQVNIYDNSKKYCTVSNKIYMNRHLNPFVSYEVEVIIRGSVLLNINYDFSIDLLYFGWFFFLAVGIERKVLNYKNNGSKFVLDTITDDLICEKEPVFMPPVIAPG